TKSSQGLDQSKKMKTKNIIILAILTFGGLMMSPAAFSGQLPHRPLPMPALRSTPVPRPVQPPSPTPAPTVEAFTISYETSAASNIAISATAGESGAPTGFSIQ